MFKMFRFVATVDNNVGVRAFATHVGKQVAKATPEMQKLEEKYPNELTDDILLAFEKARAATIPATPNIDPALLKRYPNEVSKESLDKGLKQAKTLRDRSSVY